MNTKVALLLLVPILSMIFISAPLATASRGGSPTSVYLRAWCYSDSSQNAYASVRFAGHYVETSCVPNSDSENYVYSPCFTISRPSSYYAENDVANDLQIHTGRYGPSSGTVFHTLDGTYDTYGEWEITSCEV